MRSVIAKTGVTMGIFLLAAAAGAEGIPASIARCKAIGDDTARLACYDAASGRSSEGYITASAAGAAAVAASTVAADSATAVAGTIPAATEQVAGKPANSFESRIKTATRRSVGTWVIALEDGTSWLQADPTQEWTLAAGDPVVLTRGAMGAWYVQKSGVNRTFRVRPDTR